MLLWLERSMDSYVQQIDGSKRIMYLKASSLTPVYKLSESVSDTYTIPMCPMRGD